MKTTLFIKKKKQNQKKKPKKPPKKQKKQGEYKLWYANICRYFFCMADTPDIFLGLADIPYKH